MPRVWKKNIVEVESHFLDGYVLFQILWKRRLQAIKILLIILQNFKSKFGISAQKENISHTDTKT